VSQEHLGQGFGDLLGTLDHEVSGSHLIGDLTGESPEAASVRRVKERHPEFLAHEPELAAEVGDLSGISYTQWELWFAFHHQRHKLVYIADPKAPRSPDFRRNHFESSAQKQHLARIQVTGEYSRSTPTRRLRSLTFPARRVRTAAVARRAASAG